MDSLNHMIFRYINKRFNLILFAVFALVLETWTLTASAAVQAVPVSTPENVPIVINLSLSITNVTRPITVTVGNPAPTNGTAVPIACDEAGTINECIEYTPNANFNGIDTIVYVVTDSGDPPTIESSTITVFVGTVANEGTAPPSEVVSDTLTTICIDPPPDNEVPEITDFCRDSRGLIGAPNEEDLREELARATAPTNVAAAGTLSNDLASQQLNNIGKRLAALRSGQRLASMGGLALQHNNNTISGAQLAQMFDNQEIPTGGGAAADSYGNQWGWFINGTFGGGSQDQTIYEDGFEFDTSGLSSGFDYRIRNKGVIGFAMGYANTDLELDHDGGGLDADGVSAMVYGSFYPSSKIYIDSILTTGYYSLDSRRHVVYGVNDDVASSDPDSLTIALSLAGGYELFHKAGFTGTFEGKAEYINTTIDGYSESGTSPYNVTIEKNTYDSLRTLLSMDFVYAASLSWGVLLPQLGLTWIHDFQDTATIDGYFNVDPDTPFSFSSNTADSDYFKADLGLSTVIPGGHTAYFQGSFLLSQEYYQSWYVSLGYRLEF